jgi:hypothetical protein
VLTELTPEQWANIHTWRDRFIADLCDPNSLDESAVTAAVKACYAAIGHSEPAVVWVDGPLSVLLAGAWVGQLGDQLGGQLWDQLGGQLRGAIIHGWWAADIAYSLVISGLRGINPVTDDLRVKAEATHTALRCHFWLPLSGVAIMSRQHTELHRDHRGRLHNLTGPAWAWADGTTVHALEGIRLPAWAIESPDPARFLAELTNAEQRRVTFAAYGWARAARELGWRVLDDSGDPYTGVLYELPAGLLVDEDDESLNLLVGRNGSPHPGGQWAFYGLPVSREHRAVVDAQASLWGVSPGEWLTVGVRT